MAFKFSKQEMQKMEDLIKNFIETMGIKIVVPVDIFKLATDIILPMNRSNAWII